MANNVCPYVLIMLVIKTLKDMKCCTLKLIIGSYDVLVDTIESTWTNIVRYV